MKYLAASTVQPQDQSPLPYQETYSSSMLPDTSTAESSLQWTRPGFEIDIFSTHPQDWRCLLSTDSPEHSEAAEQPLLSSPPHSSRCSSWHLERGEMQATRYPTTAPGSVAAESLYPWPSQSPKPQRSEQADPADSKQRGTWSKRTVISPETRELFSLLLS